MRPELVTLPPILGAAGTKKLGKRDGAKDILDYKKEGYLPEAMFNFLAFIGWNPGEGDTREVMTSGEIMKSFEIKHIQKGGAKFNEEKLDWLNKEHIKKLPPEEIEKNILEWLPEEMRNNKITAKIIPVILERISKWGDAKDMAERGELDFFFKQPEIDKEKLIYKNVPLETISNNLKLAIRALEVINDKDFNQENIKEALLANTLKLGSRGELLHPVRFALSGLDKSPDPFIIASILGKNETLLRLQKAI
jgi:glutamyl/glutaminyl-tRNA synthetase